MKIKHLNSFITASLVSISLFMLFITNCAQNALATPSAQTASKNIYLPFVTGGKAPIPTPIPSPIPSPTPSPTPITPPLGQAIIIDHRNSDITKIPANWIELAKQKVVWLYIHQSHGAQLYLGADYLSQYVTPPQYHFLEGLRFIPSQTNPIAMRMSQDEYSWVSGEFYSTAKNYIKSSTINPGELPVYMWAWCWDMSYFTEADVQEYLDEMSRLETDYPNIKFVYMTGVTDNTVDQTILNRNNSMIRNFAIEHNKVLYDVADIESWLPDGTLYNGIPDDSCPWCQSWCDSHPGYCPVPEIDCPHSHSLICYLKGQAFWWLAARLVGWDGTTQ